MQIQINTNTNICKYMQVYDNDISNIWAIYEHFMQVYEHFDTGWLDISADNKTVQHYQQIKETNYPFLSCLSLGSSRWCRWWSMLVFCLRLA